MTEPTQPLLHNLLDDPVLGIEDAAGRRHRVTLPGLLARLSNGLSTSLTAVQAHQQHPVHAFLVQLSALALVRANEPEVAHDEATWRELLLRAAEHDGGGIEAFALVVCDLGKPAFLQPPIPEGTLDALKNRHACPAEELDVLITAKNHDVKIGRLDAASVEHWVYALITLQTMQGFFGVGNYGIARMNGGFASRPCVAFAPDLGLASRFLRDVKALVGARCALSSRLGKRRQLGLVWCDPWDGTKSVAFDDLDPFFIEVCRRIRLSTQEQGCIVAFRGTSRGPRIDSKASSGNTGDAWTPVAPDGKALTVAEDGFRFDRVRDLLFGDWQHGAAGEPTNRESDRYWVGQVLVRGQGRTGGYHERWIPVPPQARGRLSSPKARNALGARSEAWAERARSTRLQVLKLALLTFLQVAPDRMRFDDDRVASFLDKFEASVDEVFFPMLFEYADQADEVADAVFERRLVELARGVLDFAFESLPVPSARRFRAEALALRAFEGAAKSHLKLAFLTDSSQRLAQASDGLS